MKLSVRLAAAFVAFVVFGSLVLVLWLGLEGGERARQRARAEFIIMAQTNAEVIRTQKLPISERTARSLSEVLGVQVLFVTRDARDEHASPGSINYGKEWIDPFRKDPTTFISSSTEFPAVGPYDDDPLGSMQSWRYGKTAGAVDSPGRVFDDGWLAAVAQPLDEKYSLALLRPVSRQYLLWGASTAGVLAGFWLFSLVLAWALARSIVRPLRRLAARLPQISYESIEPIPEVRRTDEIGDLARAYADTRTQLAAEREARQQAERLAALGKMATGLAHEINNPVAAIKLHAQLLEEAGQDAGDLREEVGIRLPIILAESAKIESLVSQWMFLARPQPPQTSPCDFAEILATTIRTLAPAAQHADVQVTSEVPPGCIVAADRRRLSQAITNVITNAIHAMAARGGTLTVRSCARESAGTATHAQDSTPRSHERSYDFTFTDTGPGFSAAALASATELFFSEKEGGMGIGLNVAAGILNAHGGELRIANAPGGGAVVTFVLPAAS